MDNWAILPFERCINKISISKNIKISKKDYLPNGKIPIIDQGNSFISGYSNDELFFEDFPAIIFGDHTCIFKYVDFPFLLGADGTKVIVPKRDLLNTKYFYYYLRSLKIKNQGYKRHYKFLKERDIIIPPLDIQKQIVIKLEKVEELISYRNKSLEELDSYLKSVFLEMFGDLKNNSKNFEKVLFEEIASFKTKTVSPEDFKTNYVYVGLENIDSNEGSFNNLKIINDVNVQSNKYYFDRNMILYGKLRPYLNKVALPYFNGVCSTDIIPIMPNNNTNKYFIKFLLSSSYYVTLATEKSSGANLPRISPSKLKKFEVILPPIELQNQFAEIVKQVEEIKKYQLESKKELENLFNNLMQKAFKGELIC